MSLLLERARHLLPDPVFLRPLALAPGFAAGVGRVPALARHGGRGRSTPTGTQSNRRAGPRRRRNAALPPGPGEKTARPRPTRRSPRRARAPRGRRPRRGRVETGGGAAARGPSAASGGRGVGRRLRRRRRRRPARRRVRRARHEHRGRERPDDARVVEADVVARRAQRDDGARRLALEVQHLDAVADAVRRRAVTRRDAPRRRVRLRRPQHVAPQVLGLEHRELLGRAAGPGRVATPLSASPRPARGGASSSS